MNAIPIPVRCNGMIHPFVDLVSCVPCVSNPMSSHVIPCHSIHPSSVADIGMASPSKAAYIPYQDSKLTMLLSPGLGGDSKTSVVVCGSMDLENAKETVQVGITE